MSCHESLLSDMSWKNCRHLVAVMITKTFFALFGTFKTNVSFLVSHNLKYYLSWLLKRWIFSYLL